ncbi:MAG: ComF family protein [Flavobacteriales bacterium]|nr:ComF family protein [Flavobacteriales bacterium]
MNIQDFTNNKIQHLFWGRLELKKASAYLKFEQHGKTQHLLHALKYKGIKEVGITLGELAAIELMEGNFFAEIDVLLPIPIHRIKTKKRGFNQSHFIAKGISNITEITIDVASMIKNINTKSQTKKNRFERFENVSQTFEIVNSKQLEHKHVLLIDDVVTTGATIEACGNTLRNINGIQLSLLTIASTY